MKLSELDYTTIITETRLQRLSSVLSKRQPDLTVVLENIYDEHNLSACLRSCDAVGIKEICLVNDGSVPYNKPAKKSSASAWKWLDFKRFSSTEKCFEYLHGLKFKIYTTHLSADSVSLYDMNLTEQTAFVFGNEHAGVTAKAVELADGNFLIPQVGMIQSLNISVACAVTLYEAFRQKKISGHYENLKIEENIFQENLKNWAKK